MTSTNSAWWLSVPWSLMNNDMIPGYVPFYYNNLPGLIPNFYTRNFLKKYYPSEYNPKNARPFNQDALDQFFSPELFEMYNDPDITSDFLEISDGLPIPDNNDVTICESSSSKRKHDDDDDDDDDGVIHQSPSKRAHTGDDDDTISELPSSRAHTDDDDDDDDDDGVIDDSPSKRAHTDDDDFDPPSELASEENNGCSIFDGPLSQSIETEKGISVEDLDSFSLDPCLEYALQLIKIKEKEEDSVNYEYRALPANRAKEESKFILSNIYDKIVEIEEKSGTTNYTSRYRHLLTAEVMYELGFKKEKNKKFLNKDHCEAVKILKDIFGPNC